MKKSLFFLFFLLSHYAYSQDVELPTVVLDSVIVTTSRYQRNINELPYSAAILSLEKIDPSTSQSVSELLRTEPGISLLRDGIWGTEVNIRGLSRSNIVTLIDGNRIETATDISARLSMFDINDIERIEVIKGAASTLYGTGATGGVVNIISKKESYSNKFFMKGSLSNGYNSVNNNYLGGINLSAGEQWWTAKLTGSYRKAGNAKTPGGTLNNSQYKDNSFSGMFNIMPFDSQELRLVYQQFNAFDVGIPGGYSVFPGEAKVRYPEENRKMFSSEYVIRDISSSLRKLSARYFNQSMLRDVENIPNQVKMIPAGNGQPARKVSVLEINPTAKHDSYGFQVQSDFIFGETHYLISGLDYWKRSYNGRRTNSQKIEVLGPDAKTTVKTVYKTIVEKPLPDADYGSIGVFLNDELSLIEKRLKLILGGRFDLISINNSETKNPVSEINDGVVNNTPSNQIVIWRAGKAQNTSYNYNIGMLYSLTANSSISFNAARSFRSPSLEERYQYIDQGSVLRIGDPQLKPEKGYFFDLGLRTNNSTLKTRTSIFYNYLNDLVTEIPGIYEGRNAFIKTNIGKASLYGFELESDYSFSPSLNLYGSVSFVRGRNLKDNYDLPQIPPLNGVSGLKLDLWNILEAEFSAAFFLRQDKIAPGELQTPGYINFNMNFSSSPVRIGAVNLRVTGGVENIFNKEYRNHLSTNRGFITSEPGRNLFIKTNISW